MTVLKKTRLGKQELMTFFDNNPFDPFYVVCEGIIVGRVSLMLKEPSVPFRDPETGERYVEFEDFTAPKDQKPFELPIQKLNETDFWAEQDEFYTSDGMSILLDTWDRAGK